MPDTIQIVYSVSRGEYSDHQIYRIFRNKKRAEEYVLRLNKKQYSCRTDEDFTECTFEEWIEKGWDAFYIEEYEFDGEEQ